MTELSLLHSRISGLKTWTFPFTESPAALSPADVERTMGIVEQYISKGAERRFPQPSPNGLATNRKLVGVEGKWYDVTNFAHRHPGGDIINYFINKDATDVFRSVHPRGGEHLIKYLKAVGTYTNSVTEDPFNRDMRELYNRLQKEGYFKPDLRWYAKKYAVCLVLLFVIIALVVGFESSWAHGLAGVFLAFFWQQNGMLMHDILHHQAFDDQRLTYLAGLVVAPLSFGMSSNWWRDEHWVHHMLLNSVSYEDDFVDPQMWEPIWAQNTKLFPLFQTHLQAFLIKIQHIIFIPVCMIAGRFGIIIDSMKREKDLGTWAAFCVHWIATALLMSMLPNWEERCLFYGVAMLGEGVLHIQLLISHYSKDMYQKEELHEMEFYRYQVMQNINITNPWWMDWFHGGLNFHIEHHCFPRVPRHNMRQVGSMIQELCRKHDVPYDTTGFFNAIWRTLVGLHQAQKLFKLDPR
ncbi:sphingolipid 10-desaturase-like isoform X3 [Branchiostoma floridae]|uniref:Sphingolipid 10-desaturase-like isoform X3 n=1 Tax=Branchiostoma floridae TaxID=7739 RepID=A0A9J7KMQ0_BRAFL|nr:sphingolipid 10-desaturase-like isoform X3 [Branchiostoma floridae]